MTNTNPDRRPARKKLIEVSIPLEAINAASAREKSIRHGHPATLHQWWARRPLAACRAVLFAQLVDDPSAWPDIFPTEDDQETERRRLHKLIERLVRWESSNDANVLNEARWEIARSIARRRQEEPPSRQDGTAVLEYLHAKAPPVYDPFSGGGSIPLEAQRLGLRAYGSDLNPVAVLIGKGLVEIPTKFAGRPPVNPEAQNKLGRGGAWNGRRAEGLAEDIRHYGGWLRSRAAERIGHLYPKTRLDDGGEATVIAWLWARTVKSPDPTAKGAMVPLASSFMLSSKKGDQAWVEVLRDASARDGYRLEVRHGQLPPAQEPLVKAGTKGGKGQAFVCVLTGTPIERSYIQAEGKAGRLSQRLMAIVAERPRGRLYLSPTDEDERIARSAGDFEIVHEARKTFLSPPTPTRAMITGGVCSAYGLETYGHLFSDRQILALSTLSGLIPEVREVVLRDAIKAGLADDLSPLHGGGSGAPAYADAVATYLAFAVDRLTERASTLCTWDTGAEGKSSTGAPGRSAAIRGTFSRQAMPMTWDFAEGNVFSESAANFGDAVGWVVKPFEFGLVPGEGFGAVANLDAAKNNYPVRPVLISTDPPYYDNIGYADLSDYFYVWLRNSLSTIWPNLFRRIIAPKAEELVATPYRFSGGDVPNWAANDPVLASSWATMNAKARAEHFFMHGMGEALTAMRKAASDDEPLAIYYAFKQSEVARDGVTSAGWASFLQAVIDAGMAVDGTWPIRTELSSRMIGRDANALASSIVLVCRKRPAHAEVISRAEFIRALKRELPTAIEAIRKAGVGPVDMQQSVIGPGMGVFSRYAKVLEDDDSPMSVKTALARINRVWEEIENELDAAFDTETQVALAWYATYGFDERPSGELITLANAKNTPTNTLFSSGVFTDGRSKASLTERGALPADWSPSTDKTLTVWECVQHTARTLSAPDGGAEAAARLVSQMGPKADDARALAYRLFEIATMKGWTAEALVYNELAQEWSDLEDRAAQVRAEPTKEAQGAFSFE